MILVTGASGFIGCHLVAALAGAGDDVRAMVRSDEGARRVSEAAPAAAIVRGDMGDEASLAGAVEGCDLVFHLAGGYRGAPAELRSVHLGGTAKLLGALPATCRLVYVSSTSVYGWDRPWPADHATPAQPESAYGRAKLAAEQLVAARPEGNVVIARPTITYGPGDTDGMLPRSLRLLSRWPRRFPGTGENRIHLLHVDDLVRALVVLGSTGDGVFVLGGPSATPVRRILGLLAEGAGLPPPAFGVPAAALRPAARGLGAAWAVARLPGQPPVDVHAVDVATRDRAYSWARAEVELGWRPEVDVEEGVPATGRWLAARAKERPPALGFDWRGYFEDADEGLGTVYERFALADVLESAMAKTGSTSVLHAPAFGMMGIPGLDAVFLARRGVRVGLLDYDAERLAAVRGLWQDLGLDPEVHLVPGPDPATWPVALPVAYDLVFSFAALWWFDDPAAVVAAQARWATRGVLSCVPNKNVFLKLRAKLWHKDLFDHLNEGALDRVATTEAAARAGWEAVDTGLFDIPPFPDTSVPLAKALRAALGRERAASDEPEAGAWAWSILPFLKGDQPDLDQRIHRIGVFERHLPGVVAPALAHHRYILFEPCFPAGSTAATQTA